MNEIIQELPNTFQTPTMAPFCKDNEKYQVVENLVKKIIKHSGKDIKIKQFYYPTLTYCKKITLMSLLFYI